MSFPWANAHLLDGHFVFGCHTSPNQPPMHQVKLIAQRNKGLDGVRHRIPSLTGDLSGRNSLDTFAAGNGISERLVRP